MNSDALRFCRCTGIAFAISPLENLTFPIHEAAVRTTPIVLPLTKIKFGIVGAGLGAGLAMIGVAIVATQATSIERLDLELRMLLLGIASGIVLGFMVGPRPVAQRVPKAVWQPANSNGLLRSWTLANQRRGAKVSASLLRLLGPASRPQRHFQTQSTN
jgi:hypothetical protein